MVSPPQQGWRRSGAAPPPLPSYSVSRHSRFRLLWHPNSPGRAIMDNSTWLLECVEKQVVLLDQVKTMGWQTYSWLYETQTQTWATALLVVLLMYYYLYLPMNWIKDLSDVGIGGGRLSRTRDKGKLPPVFPNGWFMIAESDSIKPGQVIHVIALGENLAVFRTNDGKCHALDAYCPHLGANMAIGGKVNNDCLQCPFHHWRFSGEDGKCVAVPYSQKVPKFAQVKKWLTCEVNDFIFLWYHAEGEEPNWYPEDIPQLKSKKYIYRGRNQFIVNCHVQEVSENGGDLSHFQAVHTASVLSGSDLRFFEKACLHFFRHNWSATWEPSSEPGRHHVGISKLSHQITLFGKLKLATCLVDVYQNGPGYVELYFKTSFGPMVLLQTVTPVEPLLQKIVHRIYCPPLLSLYASFALFAESIMIERDIMVWNHKKYIDKPLLVKEDKTLAKHRRWFSQFYSENSPLFSSRKENMDW